MDAQLRNIDVIANNVANVSTSGFRRDRAHFADLFYSREAQIGAPRAEGPARPVGILVGNGVRFVATEKEFEPGSLENSGGELHVAIGGTDGNLFFRIRTADGREAFTRSGAFTRDSDGNMVTPNGDSLEPAMTIPQDAKSVTIARDGTVSYSDGESPEDQILGRITLARFTNPAGLEPFGDNLFRQTASSGEPQDVLPDTGGAPPLHQRFLEASNVKAINELVRLIQSQRAYEINSNVIRTSDEALQVANNLRS
ncbi:MAG: flagellar basal-body rod protein FlgG [Planctomycetes bacterium]|nr:flagellar basal-body rod protein FlgG [Planctomycetota bacterium]